MGARRGQRELQVLGLAGEPRDPARTLDDDVDCQRLVGAGAASARSAGRVRCTGMAELVAPPTTLTLSIVPPPSGSVTLRERRRIGRSALALRALQRDRHRDAAAPTRITTDRPALTYGPRPYAPVRATPERPTRPLLIRPRRASLRAHDMSLALVPATDAPHGDSRYRSHPSDLCLGQGFVQTSAS